MKNNTKSKALNSTKFAGLKKGLGMSNILNAIRNDSSAQYQKRVPIATRDNLKEVGKAILNYTPNMNEYVQNLVNRIGMVVISNKLINNPLKEFKRGMLEFGDTIEEIFVDIAKSVEYTPFPEEGNEADVYKITFPDVEARFHRINREEQYPVTITRLQLRKAFTSWNNLEDFTSKVFESLYSGANLDEFILMKQLISEYNNNSKFYEVKVADIIDERTAKDFATVLQEYCENLTFGTDKYNAANVTTTTPLENQIILINPKYKSKVNIEVLAVAFNLNKADFMARVVTVDDFGSDATDVIAVLVDKDWFMVYDYYLEMTEQFNAKHVYWNYFLQVQQVLSVSEFANAVIFKTSDVTPSVTSVSITPASVNMKLSGTKTFTAEVDVLNGAETTISATLSGKSSATTTATVDGNKIKVVIGADETSSEITLKVTSTVDTTKYDESIITVVDPAQPSA